MGASGAASENGSYRYPIENWRIEGLPKSSLETMGVSYTVFVLPEAAAMDFSPDGRVLSEIVALLCRLNWGRDLEGIRVEVGDDAGGISAVPVHKQARVNAFDRLIAQPRGFSFQLTAVPDDVFWPDGERREDGLSRKYDFSDDAAGMFRPEYCDGTTVIWSPFLVSVPRDSSNGTPVPCGGCGADVLEDIDARTPEARGLHFAGIAQEVPERCRSCGILLEPRGLIAERRSGITGELVPETAPFARFVIALNPAPKAHPPVYPQWSRRSAPRRARPLRRCAIPSCRQWS